MAPRLNMDAQNRNFLKLFKTLIAGAFWFRLGLIITYVYFVFDCLKSDKNDGVKAWCENARGL